MTNKIDLYKDLKNAKNFKKWIIKKIKKLEKEFIPLEGNVKKEILEIENLEDTLKTANITIELITEKIKKQYPDLNLNKH